MIPLWGMFEEPHRPMAVAGGGNGKGLTRLLGSPPEEGVFWPETDALPSPGAPPWGHSLLKGINEAFNLQLEMIRQALNLTTVAFLWPDSRGELLRLRGLASVRRDIDPGPYPLGKGIAGAFLQGHDEIAAAPVRESYPSLPYYRDRRGVGSLFALRLGSEETSPCGRRVGGLLCADRVGEGGWTEGERQALRLAARRLAFDLSVVRQLQEVGRERTAFERVCGALRELNGALGLRSAFEATVKAIRMQASAEFIAVTLADERCHHVLLAEGREASDLSGKTFPLDQGLVGKALKFNSVFPMDGELRGGPPVFGPSPSFADYRSLLAIPLRREKGPPAGALVVAARRSGAFPRGTREILELIAAQVSVKIDLARAHEQISEMATTDGLTGMANQRAFRRGFEVMLQRARRRGSPLGLIVCDIDHFKRINDTYGHPFGDEVLKGVAGVITDAVRVVDLAARNGGEEFAVVLEDSDRQGVRQVAERLRRGVERLTLHHRGEAVRVTISLGLTVFPGDGDTLPRLVSQADEALYRAKKGGRNRVVDWSE